MSLSIILKLPLASTETQELPKLTGDELEFIGEFLDDDDDKPLFLWKACRLFSKMGLCFEVNGFFDQAWPPGIEAALNLFLEQLPGLFQFLDSGAEKTFTLEFYEQGLETDFSFTWNVPGDQFQVVIAPRIERPLARSSATISIAELRGQLCELAETYFTVLSRCMPSEMENPWNIRLRSQLEASRQRAKDAS